MLSDQIDVTSAALIVCGFAGLFLLWFANRNRRLPPGPFSLPWLGNLLSLDAEAPYLSLAKFAEKFGKVYSLQFGSVPCIVISDANIMKEVFSLENASGRAPLYLTHGIMEGYGLICSEGKFWKEQRLWVSGVLKQILKGRDIEAEIGEVVCNHLEENLDLWLDPAPVLAHFIGNFMNKLIFGLEYDASSAIWIWLQGLREEGIRLMGISAPVNFLPILRFLPENRRNIAWIKKGQKETHQEYQRIIDERTTLLESGHPPECVTDYFLLEMKDRKEKGKDFGSFSIKQLYYLQADLFGAGTDTTLISLLWNILFISSAEKETLLKSLQEEVDSGFSSDSQVSLLRATTMEVSRLRPVTPLGVPHGTTDTIKVGSWLIPKGTMLLPNHWFINRDPQIWKNPDTFDEKRFLELDNFKHILPFQAGKRRCIGAELARDILEGVLTQILKKFDMQLDSNIDPWHKPDHGFTLNPQEFRVKFTRR